MAIVGICEYDRDGSLRCPDKITASVAAFDNGLDYGPENRWTFDVGRTHAFQIHAMGRSPRAVKESYTDQLREFYEEAEFVPNFTKLTVYKSASKAQLNNTYIIKATVVYAVEDPAARRAAVLQASQARRSKARPTPATPRPAAKSAPAPAPKQAPLKMQRIGSVYRMSR